MPVVLLTVDDGGMHLDGSERLEDGRSIRASRRKAVWSVRH